MTKEVDIDLSSWDLQELGSYKRDLEKEIFRLMPLSSSRNITITQKMESCTSQLKEVKKELCKRLYYKHKRHSYRPKSFFKFDNGKYVKVYWRSVWPELMPEKSYIDYTEWNW